MRHDRRGEDSILPTFMFVAVFLVGSALLISLMTSLFAEARRGDWDVLENYQIIGGIEYGIFNPEAGYEITSANITDDYMTAENFEFTLNETSFGCKIVRDSIRYTEQWALSEYDKIVCRYLDSFIFRDDWGWWSYDMDAVSFEQVAADQVGGSNMSKSIFFLRDQAYTLFVTTGGSSSDHESLIWANQFNLSVGRDLSTLDTVTSASFWTILGQMMSASLPNTHWIINYLVSAIMWSAIGFMAIVVIVWFIPF
jgi:hypothetical protein